MLRLLRGEDLEALSRELGVTAAALSGWRDQFLEGGAAILKAREVDVDDEETQRLKSLVADLSMNNELLREKNHRVEAEDTLWSGGGRSHEPRRFALHGATYGVVRVTREWEMARSSFYFRRKITARPCRSSVGTAGTEDCLERCGIARGRSAGSLTLLHFTAKAIAKCGHGCALRNAHLEGAGAEADARSTATRADAHASQGRRSPCAGTIITERPNEVWASDHTMTATLEEGQVTVLVAVDHCTTECVGLHAAKKATRFEAMEPLRPGMRDTAAVSTPLSLYRHPQPA